MRCRAFAAAAALLFALACAAAAEPPAGNTILRGRPAPGMPPRPPELPGAERGWEAWAVADAADGRVLAGEGLDRRWRQASLTKLMLALVVLDVVEEGSRSLAEPVVVSRRAQEMGGSQVFLRAGEVFSLEELMRAALVESANDAAMAAAEHIAGSAEACIALMNRKARELGMEDTSYASVHGLPPAPGLPDNVSTCRDLIRLARAAIERPQILAWTALVETPFRGGSLRLHNKNRLVGRVPGVDGLKTGYTRRAGFNLIATAAEDGRRLIVVVLGAPDPRLRDAFAAGKFTEFLRLEVRKSLAPTGRAPGG